MTQDEAADRTRHIRAWRVPVAKGHAKHMMSEIVQGCEGSGAKAVVFRGDLIFGLDHVRAAYLHALDAAERGSSSSDSLQMEVLLYASGERQLASAIKKMSVDEGTDEMVVASIGEVVLEAAAGWTPLQQNEPVDVSRLRRFGISERELETVEPGKEADLVLERVASVEVLKK